MKTLLSFFTISLVSTIASAGGGGGGAVLMSTMSVKSPEIVYALGQADGIVKFAYGQVLDGKWDIQKIEISEDELSGHTPLTEALENSKQTGSWGKIEER